jgi:hypothetical protein
MSNPSIRTLLGPTALEVRHPIDAIMERAGEVEIIGDEWFESRPVLGDVRLIAGARDGSFCFLVQRASSGLVTGGRRSFELHRNDRWP